MGRKMLGPISSRGTSHEALSPYAEQELSATISQRIDNHENPLPEAKTSTPRPENLRCQVRFLQCRPCPVLELQALLEVRLMGA